MSRLTPHNVLKLTVAVFLASALGLWLTVRGMDPEADPVLAGGLFLTMAVICAASFLTPLVYIVKKARLRGRVTGATVAASLRQSLWAALLAAGILALWLGRVLTPATFLLWALALLMAEMAARSWIRVPHRSDAPTAR